MLRMQTGIGESGGVRAGGQVVARTAMHSVPRAEHHQGGHDENAEDCPPNCFLIRPLRRSPVRLGRVLLLCVVHEISPWSSELLGGLLPCGEHRNVEQCEWDQGDPAHGPFFGHGLSSFLCVLVRERLFNHPSVKDIAGGSGHLDGHSEVGAGRGEGVRDAALGRSHVVLEFRLRGAATPPGGSRQSGGRFSIA